MFCLRFLKSFPKINWQPMIFNRFGRIIIRFNLSLTGKLTSSRTYNNLTTSEVIPYHSKNIKKAKFGNFKQKYKSYC